MKYHELKVSAKRPRRRVGRGIAAGQGKTAGRGTKGQGSRGGNKLNPGFEGGQNPLMQRLPKLRGFKTHKTAAENVYTGQLNAFSGQIVDSTVLAEAGLLSSPYVSVKLINKGEVTKKVTVRLPFASLSAIEAVQKAGGTFEKAERLGQPKTRTDKAPKA
jgi:large subunit ribosomal protein L15